MTILIEKFIGDKLFIDGFCKHDEDKPTDGIAMGSRLLEADTGDIYRFVNETDGWNLSDEGGSGGGGSGLPSVTASDVGSGLSVQSAPVVTGVFVPEQTAEYDDYDDQYSLATVNESAFELGKFYEAIVNGQNIGTALAGINPDSRYVAWSYGDDFFVINKPLDGDTWLLVVPIQLDGADITVTANALETDHEVIVPEQTVTTDAEGVATLSNVNTSLFVDGTPVCCTLNGSYGDAQIDAGTAVINGADFNCEIWKDNGDIKFWGNEAEAQYTVKLENAVPVTATQWVVDPYAGYDVVVKMDKEITDLTLTADDLHLIKGSFAECVSRMEASLPIRGLVFAKWLGENDYMATTTYSISTTTFVNYGNGVTFNVQYAGNPSAQKQFTLTESGFSNIG